MQLSMLIRNFRHKAITGSTEVEIGSLCYDSRRVKEGSMFFALRGAMVDGHRYIPQAIENQATAVVAEEPAGARGGTTWVEVANSRSAMADAACAYFEDPSRSMAVAGITGTNGKTTTAFLLHHLLKATWKRCGLIGTVRYDTGDEEIPAERTTPESLDLQEFFSRIRDAGSRGAVMEVSSHGLAQDRVRGVDFDVAVFTNLTQEHLDYHGDMESYYQAKERLFDMVLEKRGGEGVSMVLNADDAYGQRLIRKYSGKAGMIRYGMGMQADFRARDVRVDFDGTVFQLEAKNRSTLVRLPLVGRYNVSNALAALAAGSALGINLRESVANLADAPQVPGRLESINEKRPFKVFVDYAHTPDALENVLRVVRDLSPRRLITVCGCGGDRDRAKRPLMGRAAEQLSDAVVVTSDNPRSEDPGAIIEDIVKGMTAGRHTVIEDRREAIGEAIFAAGPRDIVVIAGKGHETYQEIGGEKRPFNDVETAREFMREWEPRRNR